MNLQSGRVLIVKTSSMGDVVHAMPALSDIAANRPGLTVDWLVEAPFAAIPAMHPGVTDVIPIAWRKWRKGLMKAETRAAVAAARERLRSQHYDLIIDLQGLVKSVMWGVQAHGPMVGYDRASIREPLAALAYRQAFAVPQELQAVERCRRLVALALGFAPPAGRPRFDLHPPPPADGDWPLPPAPAVLIPCASRPEKLWPDERWIALGRWLREQGLAPVVFWGNEEERLRAERIATACGGVVPPFLTVAQTAGLLGRAHQIVGLDTGFTHLGAALGVATIGIYTDHDPKLTGVTGDGPTASFGGVGQNPDLEEVQRAVAAMLRPAGAAARPPASAPASAPVPSATRSAAGSRRRR